MSFYKVLNEDGTPFHGGTGRWNLPTRNEDGSWTAGKWMPPIRGPLVLCNNGYHLCTASGLLDWPSPAIFEAEIAPRTRRIEEQNEIVARKVRLLRRLNWNRHIMGLFVCDCAEHVLPLFEQKYPGDERPREYIRVAQRFAIYEAAVREVQAARVAACDALQKANEEENWDAHLAVWATIWAAKAVAWRVPWSVVCDVVGAAAKASAYNAVLGIPRGSDWDAAWDTARAAEREWQTARLMGYLYGDWPSAK